ncbi:hypothetical protein [Noviherbaspirillum saxi]|nr:hypothetical protein [Noviherbaspirillum saxi]
MNKLWMGLVLVAISGLAACQPQGEHGKLRKDMNGMILGDDTQPAQPLHVGVGDTATRLMARNPYLKQFKLNDQEELRLPLMTKLDVHYDDGDIKLDVGCAFTTNIDGNARFPGAAFIGIKLCDQPLNDWKPALQRATEIMRRLEQQNPQVQNLRDFYRNASEPELQKIGGKQWRKSQQDMDMLRTLEEADAKFAQEAAGGNEEILSGKWRNTEAFVGVYAGKHAIFEIGVSKVAEFGGSNLTEEQRRTMRYEVTMSFRLRNDVDPKSVQR